MDLETWVIELLDDILTASVKDENYDLHLESVLVHEIADAYKNTVAVSIY